MEDYKTIALDFLRLLGKCSADLMDIVTDDFKWVVEGGTPALCPLKKVKDRKKTEESLIGLKSLLPDLHFDVVSVTCEENRVAVEARSVSTVTNNNQHSQIYSNSYFILFFFRDDKIYEIHEYCDTYYANAVLS